MVYRRDQSDHFVRPYVNNLHMHNTSFIGTLTLTGYSEYQPYLVDVVEQFCMLVQLL